jgi:RHS repeat-associated protein
VFDASGVKHQAKYSYSTSTSLIPLGATTWENTVASSFQTDYCGNYIYQKSGTGSPKLLRILTPEGYISTYLGMISYLGYWTYTYFLKDHLGNTRVNINSDYLSKNTSKAYGASDQIDYYPFGMERSNTNQTSGGPFNSGTNPYLYNGKEIDRMNGLNENDYGARWYDAAVGRWGSVDPHAENTPGISPYAYCYDNPVRYIDPLGMDGEDSGSGQKDIYGRNRFDSFSGMFIPPIDRQGGMTANGFGDVTKGHYKQTKHYGYRPGDSKAEVIGYTYYTTDFVWDTPEQRMYGRPKGNGKADRINDVIGGFGAGMSRLKGTFRLSNSSGFSLKYYA